RWIGLCFAYCYLLFLPLHFINFIDFRPMMYSIPFLIFTYYFYVTKRFRYFVLFSVLTIICKENLGFIIAMFGLLSLFKQRKLRWVLFPFFFGILWFVFSVKIVLPFLGYKRYEPLWKYLGGQKYNFYPVFQKFFNNPLEIFQTMTGYGHIQYLLKIFNPYIYLLAFLSPGILFLSLPTFMEIMLQSEWSQLHFQAGHYICGIIVFAFIAIIYTYKKIFLIINKMNISLKKKNNIIKILIFILLTWTLVSNFGDTMIVGSNAKRASAVDPRFLNVKNMFNPVFYLQDYEDKIAWEFIEKIPPDSSVAASSDLLPALSSRKELYEFGLYKFADKDYLYYLPPKWGTSPEYIILRKHSINHGYTKSDIKNKDLVNEAERLVRQEQYKKVKETELFLLLKKIN
ncbi:DUF2079 domain-containing protein, partial [Candidatus Babeliales bacterium]|nr:DUF2079 domain-containing protein [Candidatus Babeliales bacterium]